MILYDEAMKIKQVTNYLKEENLKLKTRAKQAENELEKKERIIQDLIHQSQKESRTSQKYCVDMPSVIALKKELKDIKELQITKEEEIQRIKEAVKINKVKSLESSLDERIEECERLKERIIELVQIRPITVPINDIAELEEKIKEHDEEIRNEKQENFKLANSVQEKEEELEKVKENTISLERKVEKLESINKENLKLKKVVEDNKKEIEKIKEQIVALNMDGKEKQITNLKARVADLMQRESELYVALRQRNFQVQDLEQKLVEPKENSEAKQLRSKISRCI